MKIKRILSISAMLIILLISGYIISSKSVLIAKIAKEKKLTKIDNKKLIITKISNPDLQVVEIKPGFDTIVKIKNTGPKEAKFTKAAPLIKNGDVRVPKDGVIKPGQVVEVKLMLTLSWICTQPTDEWQYIFDVNQRPQYQPLDVIIDPENAVPDENKSNNTYRIKRPNPNKWTGPANAKPDLVVTAVSGETKDDSIKITITVKNIGNGPAHYCGGHNSPEVEVNGKMVCAFNNGGTTFQKPGETKTYTSYINYKKVDQFGVGSGFLDPGCHKFVIILDKANKIDESNKNNNIVHTYFATKGKSCPADKNGKLFQGAQ